MLFCFILAHSSVKGYLFSNYLDRYIGTCKGFVCKKTNVLHLSSLHITPPSLSSVCELSNTKDTYPSESKGSTVSPLLMRSRSVNRPSELMYTGSS